MARPARSSLSRHLARAALLIVAASTCGPSWAAPERVSLPGPEGVTLSAELYRLSVARGVMPDLSSFGRDPGATALAVLVHPLARQASAELLTAGRRRHRDLEYLFTWDGADLHVVAPGPQEAIVG